MADIANVQGVGHHPDGQTRRDFLVLAGTALGAVAAGASIIPLISSMNPAADTLAAGGPVDIDLSKLAPGQQIVVMWRGNPIFVVNRPPEALETLQKQSLIDRLRDPDSKVHQQPPYADNWHRSSDPQFAVLVGICTHLGCIPNFLPNPNASTPATDWPGGYFCPCHGSKYDLAGRVYKGVPAPYNLPVPPYFFPSKTSLRVGENPPGVAFELSSRRADVRKRAMNQASICRNFGRSFSHGLAHGWEPSPERLRPVGRPSAAGLHLSRARAARISDAAEPELSLELRGRSPASCW